MQRVLESLADRCKENIKAVNCLYLPYISIPSHGSIWKTELTWYKV